MTTTNKLTERFPEPPRIERIAVRITALERRLDHLEHRLKQPERSNSASADFDRSECEALKAGIAALRYVQEITGR